MRVPRAWFACVVVSTWVAGTAYVDGQTISRAQGGQSAAGGVASTEPPPPITPAVINRGADGRATLRAVRLASPLTFDGRLDDDVYKTVLPITGFIQSIPDHDKPASQPTDVWILFDGDDLYVSARCWESAPESAWVANEMRRDLAFQQDHFGVGLDTFRDRRNAYMFYSNPLGGRGDTYMTNETSVNQDFNPVWDAKTDRFPGGWTVELRIPFKSLRYPPESRIWGIQMRRVLRRRNEWSYVSPVPLSMASFGMARASVFATLVGIEPPSRSQNIELKPYLVTKVTSDRTSVPILSNDPAANAGIDVKYGISQELTADFTYRTDIAQVEVDAQQINLTRFNLQFPEKRDFFLESQGLFQFAPTASSAAPLLFYSRRIGLNDGRVVPIIAGGRLTGTLGPTSVAALSIRTDEEPVSQTDAATFTVVRLKQNLLRKSNIGMMLTDRTASTVARSQRNLAYGVDATFGFYENVTFNGYYADTRTPGLHGRTSSYQAKFDYVPDRYGVTAEYLVVGDQFNPEVGFVRRGDLRRSFLSGRYSPRMAATNRVRRYVLTPSIEYIADSSGRFQTRNQTMTFQTEFQTSDAVEITAARTFDRLARPFRIASGATIPVGDYHFDNVRAQYTLGLQRRVAGSISAQTGSFYGGHQTTLAYSSGRISVTPQLSVEPTISLNRVDLPARSFTTNLYLSRVNYTFTPKLFFSGLIQFSSTAQAVSSNLRVRWEYTPGSELFVVYTDERDTLSNVVVSRLINRAVAFKINKLFRF